MKRSALCLGVTPASLSLSSGGGSIITQLAETTQYCQWYLDTLDIGSSPICDNTESEVFCWRRIHKGQLERLFHWLNSFLHSSAAHVTGSYTFFILSSLFNQSDTQIMPEVQADQQMRKS